ncbi:amino acid deaminase [Colwellia sp. 1_MG-2023]|uniref:amino acid deaminase n=1 Tax=Colwellia sp. 1_MG-2023 TaxID=3062649 RepID=UPI0026E11604|nr:amino acid deaminase [Colwellia sp. 1_MG-2023]MDO6445497.1 amino acid deaminase [Colwellia sp. 1_MG-2023]
MNRHLHAASYDEQGLTFEKGSGDLASLPTQGWNILAEEVSLPIAVLREKDIFHNAQWMQSFSEQAQVKLAPHGKTSMAPELFKLQLNSGCWGMSLATIPQVVNAYQHGIKRIILANQLIGKFHCQQLLPLLQDEAFDFYCFVDSIENVQWLGHYFADKKVTLKLLVEIGVAGGRCGWRDLTNIHQLVETIADYPQLQLAGISFYEGVIHGDNATNKIVEFIENIKQLFIQLQQEKAFHQQEVIITGAGSAWYDVVAKQLTTKQLTTKQLSAKTQHLNFTPVIRPGCYLIHDTGIYQDAQNSVINRSQLACDIRDKNGGDLTSSLTVWAYVHSVPEKGLAIIGLGKRDAAFDAGLPTPELHFRPGQTSPKSSPQHWQVTKIMDQHCMMEIGANDDIKPGDMLCFSTSHPCLTLDKWRKIAIVDDNYRVTQQIATYF